MVIEPAIIVHGGAYNIQDGRVADNIKGACASVQRGYQTLLDGKSALAAVVQAISTLEDDPTYDAGHGSVLNAEGEVEMDALLMEGNTLCCASVLCVKDVANPIQLTERIMLKDKVNLCSAAASAFAASEGLRLVTQSELVTEEAVDEWRRLMTFKTTIEDVFRGRPQNTSPSDTVGCVAIDCQGNIACGTSTGGITAKLAGRVGDVPLVGCGGYCDNSVGGVSTTGHGEAITKVCLADEICCGMRRGLSPHDAAREALVKMEARIEGGHGGAICIAKNGDIGMYFNTPRMVWASMKSGNLAFGINSEDHPFTAIPRSVSPRVARSSAFHISEKAPTKPTVILISTWKAALVGPDVVSGHLKNSVKSSQSSVDTAVNLVALMEHQCRAAVGKVAKLSDCTYDALAMGGAHLDGAAVCSVKAQGSVTLLADCVRTKTPHTLVVGKGAELLQQRFSTECGQVNGTGDLTFSGLSAESAPLDQSWLVAALVLGADSAAAVAVAESVPDGWPHVGTIGCRAYADRSGATLALGDRRVLSRFVLAKTASDLLSEGKDPQSAAANTAKMVNERLTASAAELVDIIAMDTQGKVGLTRSTEYHMEQHS